MEGDGANGNAPRATADTKELKIASININGMRVAVKRRSLFDRLRRGRYDVCLVQETHSTCTEGGIWRSEWGGPAYFCHGSSGSRGVGILLSRSLPHRIVREVSDDSGRVLLLEIVINEVMYVVGSLYAPTADSPDEQSSFMDYLEEKLTDLQPVNIILGGISTSLWIQPRTETATAQ